MSPRDFSAVSAYLATAEAPSRAVLAERVAERAGLDAARLPQELEEEIDQRWEALMVAQIRQEIAEIDEEILGLQARRIALVLRLPSPPKAATFAANVDDAHEQAAFMLSLWRWEAQAPRREGGVVRASLGGLRYVDPFLNIEATYLHGEGRNRGVVLVEGTMKDRQSFSATYALPVDATPSKVSARDINDALGSPRIEIRRDVRRLLVRLMTEAS